MVRKQLQSILDSETFSRSERLCSFLRFVVEETLAGRGNALKEQVLLTDLYRKRPGSATDDDPIVRVDARRLRDKLREYYAENERDPIIISLPKGSYTPLFERNAAVLLQVAPVSLKANPLPEPSERATNSAKRWIAGTAAVSLLAAFIAWRAMQAPTPVPRVVSLTAYPGLELDPSLSPDGNFVAFAWTGSEKRGPLDIWIKAVDAEALRRLTDTPHSESSPAWSPDGKEIAFDRSGQGVFVMSQLGGSERRISNSGRFPKWTPDGRSILVRDVVKEHAPGGIYQIDLATLNRRQITQAPSGDGDWKFEVSPDGAAVAFNRYERSGVADVYLAALAGGEPVRLTDWGATIFGLTWSADGVDIIFGALDGPLRRIPARTATPGKGTRVAGLGPFGAFRPSISRPARGFPARLAFESQRMNLSLRMLDLVARLTGETIQSQPFLDGRRIDIPGRFSPDGEKIAFQSGSVGNPWRLCVARRDGSDFRPIVSSDVFIEIGKWSPDGRKILYSTATRGNSDFFVIGEDGGEPKQLTTDSAMDLSPSWSQDGKWIYFSSNRTGRHEIWKIPAEGGTSLQVTRNGGAEPIESLDGKSIFYLDRQPVGLDSMRVPSTLKTVPAGGGQEKVVIEGVRFGLWDVVSRGILFLTVEKDFDAIDLYRIPDEKLTRVGRLPFRLTRRNGLCRVAFSPDGRWALANQVTLEESDLLMIENFR